MASSLGRTYSRIIDNIILRTTLYYIALFTVARLAWRLPVVQEAIHTSLEALASDRGFAGLSKSAVAASTPSIDPYTLAVTVGLAMGGAILLAIPIAWIYTLTRQKRGYQQSVVQTLILLPALVAGVVVLVKYSVALAFSLGGIVAAVKFRNTLDDSKDAVYIFLATTVGLAAGVQLPVAAVISVGFNFLVLMLWYTNFGAEPAAYEGAGARRKLEETRDRLRETGSFVAMVDKEIFANMTPEQLDLVADRAWRRRRRDIKDDVPLPDEEMQKRDVLLRLRTTDPDGTRVIVEQMFDEYLKKWRFGGVVHEPDGTHVVEFAVQLKKSTRSADLLDSLHARAQILGAEIV